MLGGGGVMPKYNCMDLKKYGGGVCGVVMPKYFYGFEKMLGGLCQNILWGVEKCLGGMPTNLCMDLKKKIAGGGWLCPNILLT